MKPGSSTNTFAPKILLAHFSFRNAMRAATLLPRRGLRSSGRSKEAATMDITPLESKQCMMSSGANCRHAKHDENSGWTGLRSRARNSACPPTGLLRQSASVPTIRKWSGSNMFSRHAARAHEVCIVMREAPAVGPSLHVALCKRQMKHPPCDALL